MRTIYTINIFLYTLLIRLAAPFNAKARLWLRGRRGWPEQLQEALRERKQTAWFHCASLGEFEQGRPLMERLRSEQPDVRIVLTFFSPSGYEIRKNYAGADHVFYLPADTPGNARRFLDIVQPEMVFFVKYEFWFNFLAELEKRRTPHYLISAIFRPSQHFFKSWGGWFRKALNGYTWIFTQDAQSLKLLKNIGTSQVSIAGDTRFDRVLEIAKQAKNIPLAAAFAGEERRVIVAGSSWPEDEKLLFEAIALLIASGWKLLIAPHEISAAHLADIETKLQRSPFYQGNDTVVRFSMASETSAAAAKILLIDNIGMLSSLYRYGRIAYIGGGFGSGIHNILEAAVYGMPVIFGPRFEKFNEAKGLLEAGGAFTFTEAKALQQLLEKLSNDPAELERVSKIAGDFVYSNAGATGIIFEKLYQL